MKRGMHFTSVKLDFHLLPTLMTALPFLPGDSTSQRQSTSVSPCFPVLLVSFPQPAAGLTAHWSGRERWWPQAKFTVWCVRWEWLEGTLSIYWSVLGKREGGSWFQLHIICFICGLRLTLMAPNRHTFSLSCPLQPRSSSDVNKTFLTTAWNKSNVKYKYALYEMSVLEVYFQATVYFTHEDVSSFSFNTGITSRNKIVMT